MIALVDCNNFYVSCEKVFQPALEGHPVVVLSNNDGCIISRSDEARAIGIGMGVPAFSVKDKIRKHNIRVFSTNYTLYGDFSQRVMNTLAHFSPDIEIYSIDEAFLEIARTESADYTELCREIKNTVKQWTGIPVSVGAAPTKTLAKAANYLARKDERHAGVFVMEEPDNAGRIFNEIPVKEIWGVGEKYATFLHRQGITTAAELQRADHRWIKKRLGVMGERIVLEMNGVKCYPLNVNPDVKKELCSARSFGKPILEYEDLESATVSFAMNISRKLKKENLLAGSLIVFVMTNKYARGPRYVNYKVVNLSSPTQNASEIVHYTLTGLKDLFIRGYLYKKSGVMATELIEAGQGQLKLWHSGRDERMRKAEEAMDMVNKRSGKRAVGFAIEQEEGPWKMRQMNLSPKYTTRWEELLNVNIDKTGNP